MTCARACSVLFAGLWFVLLLPGCESDRPLKTTDDGMNQAVGNHGLKTPATTPGQTGDKLETESHSRVAAESDESSRPPSRLEPVFRPEDRRPKHDPAQLDEVGIRVFESKRLKLYTDIEPESAKSLPGLIDDAYAALESYFGPVPPDRAGTEYQMSGYLMQDVALFREFKLVPEDVTFEHGRHRANEFWVREQEFEYYQRHLLIHEATHCIMTMMPGVAAPNWYLEGMAEHFGTHRLRKDLPAEFRVMPTSPKEFAGFGRITIIRKDFASNRALTVDAVQALEAADFNSPVPYAWSWALCAFLDGTPRYCERFKKLSAYIQGTQFPLEFEKTFEPDRRDLATEWTLFVVNLQYGYDIPRAAIDFRTGTVLSDERSEQTVEVAADRGWQSSGVLLEEGHTYDIAATGRFSLADHPKRWQSEPGGITFRYYDGRPLGTLLGCLRSEEGPAGGTDDSMLSIISLGNGRSFVAPVTGTLYMRLNDDWNSLFDNRGHADVTIRRGSP